MKQQWLEEKKQLLEEGTRRRQEETRRRQEETRRRQVETRRRQEETRRREGIEEKIAQLKFAASGSSAMICYDLSKHSVPQHHYSSS